MGVDIDHPVAVEEVGHDGSFSQPRGRSAMTPSARRRSRSASRTPSRPARISVVVLTESGRGRADPAVDAVDPERQGRDREAAGHRVIDHLVVRARPELRVALQRRADHEPARRGRLATARCSTAPSRSRPAAHAPRTSSRWSWRGAPAGDGRERRVGRQIGHGRSPRSERLPLRVRLDRHREPAVIAGAGVQPLRCGAGRAVAIAGQQVAVRAPLDDRARRRARARRRTWRPPPGIPRRSRRAARAPTRAPMTAWTPPFGSLGPRWIRGWSSRSPVSHASPDACSMFCANPGRSRHGPSRPNAGSRTRIVTRVRGVDRVPAETELVEHPGCSVLDDRHRPGRRGPGTARGLRRSAGRSPGRACCR